jgi:hypothetical protein
MIPGGLGTVELVESGSAVVGGDVILAGGLAFILLWGVARIYIFPYISAGLGIAQAWTRLIATRFGITEGSGLGGCGEGLPYSASVRQSPLVRCTSVSSVTSVFYETIIFFHTRNSK